LIFPINLHISVERRTKKDKNFADRNTASIYQFSATLIVLLVWIKFLGSGGRA